MIALPAVWAMAIALIVALVAAPLAAFGSFSPLESGGGLVPIVLLVEFFVYFALSLFSSRKAKLSSSVIVAAIFLVLRATGCLIASGVAAARVDASPEAFSTMLVGQPVSLIAQFLLLITIGTHTLVRLVPDLVGSDLVGRLVGGENEGAAQDAAKRAHHAPGSGHAASAVGGFVQVFSFEELSATLRKTDGLEGYVIVSSEGLVVWRDLPLRIEIEPLVARTLAQMDQFGHVMEASGLTRVRRVMVESREHLLVATPLNVNFGLVLLFSGRIPSEEVIGKLAFVTKTSREFLQWKYPSLPLATGLSHDRNPLAAV